MKQKPTIRTVKDLKQLNPAPCAPAMEWLAENNITDLADAWDRCHRGDWMLWICNALDLLSDHERRLIACKCVRETQLADGRKVWALLTDERSRRAVAVAEMYAAGAATNEQLVTARAAAEAADAVHTAARAAAGAAAAAAWAAADAAAAADEWGATWGAARAVTYAAHAAAAARMAATRKIVAAP